MLQLGDTLKALPQVYGLMITLGGDNSRECVLKIRQSIRTITSESISKPNLRLFTELKLILDCHASGHTLLRRIVTAVSDEEIREWKVAFRHVLTSMSYVGFQIVQIN